MLFVFEKKIQGICFPPRPIGRLMQKWKEKKKKLKKKKRIVHAGQLLMIYSSLVK